MANNPFQTVSHYQPEMVLMDRMMPEVDGVAAMCEIHQAYPRVKAALEQNLTYFL
jgi:CheY-like chemotaxis protein